MAASADASTGSTNVSTGILVAQLHFESVIAQVSTGGHEPVMYNVLHLQIYPRPSFAQAFKLACKADPINAVDGCPLFGYSATVKGREAPEDIYSIQGTCG